MRSKEALLFLVKATVSVLAFGYIFSRTDLEIVLKVLSQIDIALVVIGFGILNLSTIIMAHRWQILLRELSIPTTIWESIRLNYIALFFNIFLPSRIGGDITKGYYMYKKQKNLTGITLSLLADRTIGMFSFISVNLIALFLGWAYIPEEIILIVLIVDGLLIGSLYAGLIVQRYGIPNILKSLGQQYNLYDRVKKVAQQLHSLSSAKRTLRKIILWSLVSNVLLIFTNYTYARALHLDVPFIYFVVFVPIITTITMLPVSLNGLGIREYLVTVLFGAVGIPTEHALGLALVARVLGIMHGGIGVILYLKGSERINRNAFSKAYK